MKSRSKKPRCGNIPCRSFNLVPIDNPDAPTSMASAAISPQIVLETPGATPKPEARVVLPRENRQAAGTFAQEDSFVPQQKAFLANLEAFRVQGAPQITAMVWQGNPESDEWIFACLKDNGVAPMIARMLTNHWMVHVGKFRPGMLTKEMDTMSGSETDKAMAEAIRQRTIERQQQMLDGPPGEPTMQIVQPGGNIVEVPASQWFQLEMAKITAGQNRQPQDSNMSIQLEFMKMMQAQSMETTKLITSILTTRPTGEDSQKTALVVESKIREAQANSDKMFQELKTRLEKQDLVENIKAPLLQRIDALQAQQNQLLANANNSEVQHKMTQEKEMSQALISVAKEGIKAQRETRKDIKDIGVKFLDRSLEMSAGNPDAKLSPTTPEEAKQAVDWLDRQVGAAEDGGAALTDREEPPTDEPSPETPPEPHGRKRGDPLVP